MALSSSSSPSSFCSSAWILACSEDRIEELWSSDGSGDAFEFVVGGMAALTGFEAEMAGEEGAEGGDEGDMLSGARGSEEAGSGGASRCS